MALLDRHLAFLDALRRAGLPVSLSEGLDAVDGLSAIGWSDRETVKAAYAATLVKKPSLRPTFDELFELYFPRMVADGHLGEQAEAETGIEAAARDEAAELAELQQQITEALESDEDEQLRQLAAETMAHLGAMPGRGPGLSSWSSYTALRTVETEKLREDLIDGLRRAGWTDEEADRTAGRRVKRFRGLVEADARRRIAEERGPKHMADIHVRGTIERLDFLNLRREDLESLRREIYPLARRLATRLAREQHARRRGPLDMRRTVRASIGTGGVPLTTFHKPKRPHKTELVVLCDVSGSVANFASFTLLFVYALQEVFAKVRAFTFVDDVTEVTSYFTPGGDIADTMAHLVESSAHAAMTGRTHYGRALSTFARDYADALGPRTSLLVLGDARSNFGDPELGVFKRLVDTARHTYWLNPEARMHWDTGDSEAAAYGSIAPMIECRNLTQLTEFVHDLA